MNDAIPTPESPDAHSMRHYTYPHTIDNGAGESITFVRRVTGPAGDRLEVDNVVKPGSGPPMHIHHHQAEALTVTKGRIGYQRAGEPERFAGPGETVTFKAGEAHRFWNAGPGDLHCTGYIEPPDNVEFFLTALYDSTKRSGGHRPDPFDAAFLAHRYRSEFALVEIPAAVQRFVFPLQVALGKLLGKYGKYADAPEPMHR
jgi:quercetin dioxygenase-like cupin family protein